MHYIGAAMTGTLSPQVLLIMDLKKMLSHIEETLPSTLHLPVSSEDTLHFYQYLCGHVLIANKQFILLIDVPVQDQSQQLSTNKIFTLDIPICKCTSCYDINAQYLRTIQDETMARKISPQQFRICQEANGPFCNIPTPFQPLASHHLALQLCMSRIQLVSLPDVHYRLEKSSVVSMPSQLAPNAWILTTAFSAVTTTITLICPVETMKFIKVKKPIHVL